MYSLRYGLHTEFVFLTTYLPYYGKVVRGGPKPDIHALLGHSGIQEKNGKATTNA